MCVYGSLSSPCFHPECMLIIQIAKSQQNRPVYDQQLRTQQFEEATKALLTAIAKQQATQLMKELHPTSQSLASAEEEFVPTLGWIVKQIVEIRQNEKNIVEMLQTVAGAVDKLYSHAVKNSKM